MNEIEKIDDLIKILERVKLHHLILSDLVMIKNNAIFTSLDGIQAIGVDPKKCLNHIHETIMKCILALSEGKYPDDFSM